MGVSIKSNAYVVGMSLTDKAKQALMHAAEVGKDTDVSGLCEEFLSDTPYWEAFIVSDLVACFPHDNTAYALLMVIDEACKSGMQYHGVVKTRILQYDALVVIKGKSMAEGALKGTDEASRYLYKRLFDAMVSPCSYCDVLLNVGR